MTVNIILAVDDQYGIGKDNTLPWMRNDDDMKWFRDNTKNGVVVMGKNTWESIGKRKLPKRINVVVSSSLSSSILHDEPDLVVSGDIQKILSDLESKFPDKTIWVIGGSSLFETASVMCDHIYLTRFSGSYSCDTFVDQKMFDGFIPMAQKESGGLLFQILKKAR